MSRLVQECMPSPSQTVTVIEGAADAAKSGVETNFETALNPDAASEEHRAAPISRLTFSFEKVIELCHPLRNMRAEAKRC